MPFRDRVKKAFGRNGSQSDGASLKKTNTNSSTYGKKEKMPPPKYGGPIDPTHKRALEAFSFGSALSNLRRKSMQSQYSPFGSQAPSRTNSTTEPRKLFHQTRAPSHIGQVVEGIEPTVPSFNGGQSRNDSAKDSYIAPSDSTVDSTDMPNMDDEAPRMNGDRSSMGKPLTEAQVASAFATAAVHRTEV